MSAIKSGYALLTSILLMNLANAQTHVSNTVNAPLAAGSYYNETSIQLQPGFSFTASSGQSLQLSIGVSNCQLMPGTPSTSQNFILVNEPRTTINSVAGLSGRSSCELMQTIQYFDGIGRPTQTVQVKASPSGMDIVQPIAYDAYGRESVKYLPYAATSGDASYKADAFTSGLGLNQFYYPSGTGNQQSNGVARFASPQSISVIEPSPLNRITEQGAPGDTWQPVANSTTGHTVKTTYLTNDTIPLTDTANSHFVALYKVTIGSNQQRTLVRTGNQYYGPRQLYLTVTANENWRSGRGGTVEEYKDLAGHVVLKRAFNYIPGSPAILQILSTYYVYDDLGNLALVLPPGVNPDASGKPLTAAIIGQCYQYRYDERNRITQKRTPGKGWDYLVYNELDQPVLTQDSLQRMANQWTMTKYDGKGRVIMTGLWNAGSPIALATLQSSIYTAGQYDARNYSDNTTGYTISSYPALTNVKLLTVTYYDDYANIPGLPTGFTPPTGYSTSTKGLLTATKTAVLNTIANATPDMLWTAHYYDDLGRNIKTYQQHYLGGTLNVRNYDAITSTYNFNNQPTTTSRQHYASSALKLTVYNRSWYDHKGRKRSEWQQITNAGQTADTLVLVSKVDYNEIGQLWKKHLHSKDSINYRQNIVYNYNERGWLTKASSPQFFEQLQYDTDTAKNSHTPIKQYNGNIGSATTINTLSPSGITYLYKYDQLNRLTSGGSTDHYAERGITYDPVGNIATLNRMFNGSVIDSLAYSYFANSNQLQTINDRSLDAGTIGYPTGSRSYSYDGNGNVHTDPSKGSGITISYNLLNLPQSITGSKTITYTYDANGKKLRRVSSATGAVDYIDGIEYDASVLKFIQTNEGRALADGSINYNYEYTISDHLGNSRVAFDTESGIQNPVQIDDYLPFGLNISRSVPSLRNYYLYNKKELQDEITQYDFGARFYDPLIVRWGVSDPKSNLLEMSSPYVYSLNNPVNFVDKDGELPIFINGKTSHDYERGRPIYWDAEILKTIASSGIPNPGGTAFFVDGNRYMSYNANSTSIENAGLLDGEGENERKDAGEEVAKQDFKAILSQLARDPKTGKITEKIQIYTHSRGAAFGQGFTEELLNLIQEHSDEFADAENEIDFVFNMAPHGSININAVDGVDEYSMHHDRDKFSNTNMQGTKANFSSNEKDDGIVGAHQNSSFRKDVRAFVKAWQTGKKDSKKVIKDFINTMRSYGVKVNVISIK